MILGNQYVGQSVDTFNNALNFLGNTFESLTNDCTSLDSLSSLLYSDVSTSASNCPAVNVALPQFTADITAFNEQVADFETLVNPLAGYVNQADTSLNTYVLLYKNYGLWALYSYTFAVVLVGLIGLCIRSKTVMVGSLVFTMLLIIILTGMGALEMILMVRHEMTP